MIPWLRHDLKVTDRRRRIRWGVLAAVLAAIEAPIIGLAVNAVPIDSYNQWVVWLWLAGTTVLLVGLLAAWMILRTSEAPPGAPEVAPSGVNIKLRAIYEDQLIQRRVFPDTLIPVKWSWDTQLVAFAPSRLRELRNPHDIPRGDIRELATWVSRRLKTPQLLILGEPASGKTTAILTLAIAILSDPKKKHVPLIVDAKTWRPKAQSISDLAHAQLRAYLGSAGSEDTVQQILQKGLLIIDGLDELNEDERALAVARIRSHIYEGRALVLAARRADFNRIGADNLRVLQFLAPFLIEPLTAAESLEYLDATTRSRWTETVVNHSERQRLDPILRSPLLVTLARESFPGIGDELRVMLAARSDRDMLRLLVDKYLDFTLSRGFSTSPFPVVRVKRWLTTFACISRMSGTRTIEASHVRIWLAPSSSLAARKVMLWSLGVLWIVSALYLLTVSANTPPILTSSMCVTMMVAVFGRESAVTNESIDTALTERLSARQSVLFCLSAQSPLYFVEAKALWMMAISAIGVALTTIYIVPFIAELDGRRRSCFRSGTYQVLVPCWIVGSITVGAWLALSKGDWGLSTLGALSAVTSTFIALGGRSVAAYWLSRVWLAGRGDLPWRVSQSLQAWETQGLLRARNGGIEFRHTVIQDLISDEVLIKTLLARAERGDFYALESATALMVRLGMVTELKAAAQRFAWAEMHVVRALFVAGDVHELERLSGLGDKRAARLFLDLLARLGDVERLIMMFEDGNMQAGEHGLSVLARKGRWSEFDVLMNQMLKHGWAVGGNIVSSITESGRIEALKVLSQNGNEFAQREYSGYLARSGLVLELELLTETNPFASEVLVDVYAIRGDIRRLRELAVNGSSKAKSALIEYYVASGDVDSALATVDLGEEDVDRREIMRAKIFLECDRIIELRNMADQGGGIFRDMYVEALGRGGHVDELRPLAGTSPAALGALADALVSSGDISGAIELLSERGKGGDRDAWSKLADVLLIAGEMDKAGKILRALTRSGSQEASHRYVDFLESTGQFEELAALADSGNKGAMKRVRSGKKNS